MLFYDIKTNVLISKIPLSMDDNHYEVVLRNNKVYIIRDGYVKVYDLSGVMTDSYKIDTAGAGVFNTGYEAGNMLYSDVGNSILIDCINKKRTYIKFSHSKRVNVANNTISESIIDSGKLGETAIIFDSYAAAFIKYTKVFVNKKVYESKLDKGYDNYVEYAKPESIKFDNNDVNKIHVIDNDHIILEKIRYSPIHGDADGRIFSLYKI